MENTLTKFVNTIVNPHRELSSLVGPIMYYSLFLRDILHRLHPSFMEQRDINSPTNTSSGEALSPWHAAACMDDRLRTAAFIRGAIDSVQHLLDHSTHRPLHLIEAGCGPLGTLVLPLLAHFKSEDLEVSVIDLSLIHISEPTRPY